MIEIREYKETDEQEWLRCYARPSNFAFENRQDLRKKEQQ